MSRRLKVLISAYACSPVRGSEPGMGWGWVEALSQHHDLWVITEKDEFEEEVEAELHKRPELRQRVTFFFIAKDRHRTLRKLWPPSFYWFYREWHRKAYELAVELDKEVRFDLCHQLNMIGYREPGYLWQLGRPFVWGPVGGAGGVPIRFCTVLGVKGLLYFSCRNLINLWQIRYDKRVSKALARAAVFMTATSREHDIFLRVRGRESYVVNETGKNAHSESVIARETVRDVGRIRLSWSGMHRPLKALPLALKALAMLPDRNSWHLDIVGSGPMTKSWQRLAERLRISPNCTWHGWLSQSLATKVVGESDVFLFTSLSEGTPHVVMESLSMGVPVICLDHCGQRDIVTENCGIKIPVTTPRDVTRHFARAISYLTVHRDELERLRREAFSLMQRDTHSYETKARTVSALYENVIQGYGQSKEPASSQPPTSNLTQM